LDELKTYNFLAGVNTLSNYHFHVIAWDNAYSMGTSYRDISNEVSIKTKKNFYLILIQTLEWFLINFRSRNITCSAGGAMGYLISFFMIKYYLELSNFVNFYNTFTLFGISGLFGTVYFYFYLPETENKTLQEISEFFK